MQGGGASKALGIQALTCDLVAKKEVAEAAQSGDAAWLKSAKNKEVLYDSLQLAHKGRRSTYDIRRRLGLGGIQRSRLSLEREVA